MVNLTAYPAYAYGKNDAGQLGNNSHVNAIARVAVAFPDNQFSLLGIGSSAQHMLAVKSDGTVWAWGDNTNGQLGDGTTTNQLTPKPVVGLNHIVAVALGHAHSLALKVDGTVWAWGDNSDGQLGIDSTTQQLTPVQVAKLTKIVAVAAGQNHSLALKADGTVWAWGANAVGQLGDGTTDGRLKPVKVRKLEKIIKVSAGLFHTLALKSDGSVWAWGGNEKGQLGDGTTMFRSTRVQVIGLTGVNAIASGLYHNLALKTDGSVLAWGGNDHGQLGDGTNTNQSTSVPVHGLSAVTSLVTGDYHSIAITADGKAWAWGANDSGQLGDGSTLEHATPILMSEVNHVNAVAAGVGFSMVLMPPQPPVLRISFEQTTLLAGAKTTLHWASVDADTLVSATPQDWATGVNGTLEIAPENTTTYALTIAGVLGKITREVTVTVNHPPSLSLTADTTKLAMGQDTTLRWTSNYAEKVLVSSPHGWTTEVNGNMTISPTATTTYTLTLQGAWGQTTQSVTVTLPSVEVPGPAGTINIQTILLTTALPDRIKKLITHTEKTDLGPGTCIYPPYTGSSIQAEKGMTIIDDHFAGYGYDLTDPTTGKKLSLTQGEFNDFLIKVTRYRIFINNIERGDYDDASDLIKSSDGKHFAFRGRKTKNHLNGTIYSLPPETCGESVYFDFYRSGNYYRVGRPTFSHDGKSIAYFAWKGKTEEFLVVVGAIRDEMHYPETEGVERPVVETSLTEAPVFSPDGTRIAYRANKNGAQIVVTDNNVESKEYQSIESPLVFSPDGKHLAFMAVRDGRYIFVIDGIECRSCEKPVGKGVIEFETPQKCVTYEYSDVDILKIEASLPTASSLSPTPR